MADEVVVKPTKTSIFRSRYRPSANAGRLLSSLLAIILLLAGLTALILYLVYRPSSPRFSIVGAYVYSLTNYSGTAQPNAVATTVQFTISIRNPSKRASIYYDRLSAYATYRGQPITPPAGLPSMFQETKSTLEVSPVLGGAEVPVSPEVAAGLAADQEFGVVAMRMVLLGRVRYRTGAFRSGWVGLYVRCDMLLGVKKGGAGTAAMLREPECDVDV